MAAKHKSRKKNGPPILKYNCVIRNRWRSMDRIGRGAFGEIYAGVDMNSCTEVAVKVERNTGKRKTLSVEKYLLRKARSKKAKYIVKYIAQGTQGTFNYLVLERLGENLATLRKRRKNGSFTLRTTVKLGIQMLDCVESLHKIGFLHRDVKPSNFCVGRGDHNCDRIYMIDFGLARRYKLESGEVRPARARAGFRGTARYASLNSHNHKELARRDDIWSIFYSLVEFHTGTLPWRKMKDKKLVGELKERFTNVNLVKDIAPEFLLFLQHVSSLGYEDEPNYEHLRRILARINERKGFLRDACFDWDEDSDRVSMTGTSTQYGFSDKSLSKESPKTKSRDSDEEKLDDYVEDLPAGSEGDRAQDGDREGDDRDSKKEREVLELEKEKKNNIPHLNNKSKVKCCKIM